MDKGIKSNVFIHSICTRELWVWLSKLFWCFHDGFTHSTKAHIKEFFANIFSMVLMLKDNLRDARWWYFYEGCCHTMNYFVYIILGGLYVVASDSPHIHILLSIFIFFLCERLFFWLRDCWYTHLLLSRLKYHHVHYVPLTFT